VLGLIDGGVYGFRLQFLPKRFSERKKPAPAREPGSFTPRVYLRDVLKAIE
jgi:hypothetical protein